MAADPTEVTFHYLKSPSYRTAHIDGAFGGLTPTAKIALALFSERFPIPQSSTHSIEGGTVRTELNRVTKEGIIREIEFNAVMDVSAAKVIIEFLSARVAEYEAATKKAESR